LGSLPAEIFFGGRYILRAVLAAPEFTVAEEHTALGFTVVADFLAAGFHGRPGAFHGGFAGFPHGRFHGFRSCLVVVPVFGAWSVGAGLGWLYYSYPNESYYGQGPYTQYWYCEDPPGYYPDVVQCNTCRQMVPAN